MSASQSSSLPNGRRYEVVGTRPIHHDGVETVTGQARYGADMRKKHGITCTRRVSLWREIFFRLPSRCWTEEETPHW